MTRKGEPAWNRGLTKETSKGVAKQAKALSGRIHTKEHNRKVSEAKTGVPRPDIQGDKNPMRKLETRQKFMGDKNTAYIDGRSYNPYPSEFNEKLVESIRDRDGRVCRMPGCNKTEEDNSKKLDVHHIDYDKDNCDPQNLIALCVACHASVPSDRAYYQQLFEKILSR